MTILTRGTVTTVTAMLACALALVSCAAPSGEDPYVLPPPTGASVEPVTPSPESTPGTTEPAGSSTTPESPESPDNSAELTAPVPSSSQVDQVLLTPEGGVQYLLAIQNFSPLLESWVVDKYTGALEYTRFNCLGSVDDAGSGDLELRDGDRWEVTWDGRSPMRLSNGGTERLTITDSTLTLAADSASSRTDVELDRYIQMCEKAGKAVAGFVLGAVRSSSAGSAPIDLTSGPATSSARQSELEAIGAEHGVVVQVSDDQACDHELTPYVTDSAWQTTGCYVDGDTHVTLSMSTLDPRVPWQAAHYLLLHEAAHHTTYLAGCPVTLSGEASEHLADAIAVIWGAEPLRLTYGATFRDADLALLVLTDGTCTWPVVAA